MGKPVLLLRLEGPLQAWGVRSRWDVRDTGAEPSKSGIIGLLGCALGYPRGESRLEQELDAGLRFGVRVEAPGRVLVDFHTITDYLPMADGKHKYQGGTSGKALAKLYADPHADPATIISPRAYLEDAAFLVGLEETSEHAGLLARCAEALQRPVWPLYLGRKACVPTRPILEQFTEEYSDLENALTWHPWSWLAGGTQQRAQSTTRLVAFIEDPREGTLQRQDAVRINATRQYGFRAVRRLQPDPCPPPAGGEQ